jgi:perosamine synthetase
VTRSIVSGDPRTGQLEAHYLAEVLDVGFRNTTAGFMAKRFEVAFAEMVGAKYAISMCNGTATLHTALHVMGVEKGDIVSIPPLTMGSTTMAVVHAGACPLYVDVDPSSWLMGPTNGHSIGVSLYGLGGNFPCVDDAAQTLRKHKSPLTSYSLQASKILTCGEGGVLTTNDPNMAQAATRFASLGYQTSDIRRVKRPGAVRHVEVGWNYRMSDLQAAVALAQVQRCDLFSLGRSSSAAMYLSVLAAASVPWITVQMIPRGSVHNFWCFPLLLHEDGPDFRTFADEIEKHGGERPYAAWRLTYEEPAFRHLQPTAGCPVAESIQPRIVQLQTNFPDAEASEQAAVALGMAIAELNGG